MLGVVGGVGYYLYGRFSASSLLRRLDSEGPSSLFTLGVAVQPWEQVAFNPTLQLSLADSVHLSLLLQALDGGRWIVEVQRQALNALHALAANDLTRPALYAQPHLYTQVYEAAMSGKGGKEVTQMAFTLLKHLITLDAGNEAAQRQKEELLSAKAIAGLSRANRSHQPEVSGSSGELFAALVPSISERHLNELTAEEKRAAFEALTRDLGQLFVEFGHSPSAIRCFQLALVLEPNNSTVLTRMGMEQLKLGVKDQAVDTLRKAIKGDPNNGETLFYLYRTLLTDPVQGADDGTWEEAVGPLRRAVTSLLSTPPLVPSLPVHPTLSPAYHLLCKALERVGRLPEAVDAALDWRLHCPSEAVAYFTHGRLLVAAKRFDEGEEALRTARHLDASRPETLYQLALAHYKRGQVQEAKAAATEALHLASVTEPSLYALLMEEAQASTGRKETATPVSSASTSSPTSSPSLPSPFFPSLPPSTSSLLTQVDFLLAKLAMQSRDASAALYHLDRLLAYRPFDHAALMLKAECRQQRGEVREAYLLFADSLRSLNDSLVQSEQAKRRRSTAAGLPQLSSSSALPALADAAPASPVGSSASVPSSPSSATLSSYLSLHPRTAAVLSGIGQACKGRTPKGVQSSAAQSVEPTRQAVHSMCEAYEQLYNQPAAGKGKQVKFDKSRS